MQLLSSGTKYGKVISPLLIEANRRFYRPYVAQANAIAPTYSQVYKEMLLIASRDKPLEYTVKAVIARRPAMKQYKEEIDKMSVHQITQEIRLAHARDRYDYSNAAAQDPTVQAPPSWSEPDTKAWILAQVKEIVHSNSDLRSDGDLFEQGMDRFAKSFSHSRSRMTDKASSLGATILRVRLLSALRLTQHPSAVLIDEVAVYTHPSIDALASLILGKATAQVTMESLIEKYSSGLEKSLPKVQANGASASSLKVTESHTFSQHRVDEMTSGRGVTDGIHRKLGR